MFFNFFLTTLNNMNKIFFSYSASQTHYSIFFNFKYLSILLLLLCVFIGFF